MIALIATLIFVIGFIVRVATADFDLGDVWLWLLAGLAVLAFALSGWTPWRRSTP